MKHVVFLLERTIDSLFIDRRVLNQARMFVRCGWAVTILLPTFTPEHVAVEYEPGIAVRAFNQSRPPITKTFISELTGIPNDLIGTSAALAGGFDERLSTVVQTWPAPKLDELVPFDIFDIDRELYERNSTPATIFHLYLQTDYFAHYAAALKPDLIWVADYHGCRAAWRLKRRFSIPYILDFHELHWGQNHKPLRERKIVHRVEAEACREATAVTTVSDLCGELLALEYDLPTPPVTLNNVPAFQPVARSVGRRRLEATFGIPPEDRVIIFHGGLAARRRNIEPLLEAQAAVAPDGLHLLFLGSGPAEEAIRRGGPRVHFHPMVDQQTMAEFVAGSDFVLFPYVGMVPNYRFSSGNKLFDAIALRCPMIVTTELDDTCMTIENYGIGWTAPMGNSGDMKALLHRAATGPRCWDGLDAGFARAEFDLGPDVTFRRLEDLIARIDREKNGDRGTPVFAGEGRVVPRRYRHIVERRRALAQADGRGDLVSRIDRFLAEVLPC